MTHLHVNRLHDQGAHLSGVARVVALVLADMANSAGDCWPSVATLCTRTGRSRRSVQRALRALETHGYVVRLQRPGLAALFTFAELSKPLNLGTCAKFGTCVTVTPESKSFKSKALKARQKPRTETVQSVDKSEAVKRLEAVAAMLSMPPKGRA